MKNLVFATALLLLSSLVFAAPALQSPVDGYNYKVCDNLLFKWSGSSTGTYYFYASYEGVPSPIANPLVVKGNQVLIDWTIVEDFAGDGDWSWKVCNQYASDCSVVRTIHKQTWATIVFPHDNEVITPTTIFTWNAVSNSKNYIVKLRGAGLTYPWMYFATGTSATNFHMNQGLYDLLAPGFFYYQIRGTCYTNPTLPQMTNYGWESMPEEGRFQK